MKDKYCLNLAKTRHKSTNWFKCYSKNSTDTADLGSGQIAVKRDASALGGFLNKKSLLHHNGENLAQIDLLVQEIWQKQFCISSGQIAVKEGHDGLVRICL